MHTCHIHNKAFYDIPEIAKKIRFENMLKRELTPYFTQILKDFKVSVAAFGRAPDASAYKPIIHGIMQKHYARVQTSFKGDVAEQNGGKAMLRILVKQDEAALDALIGISLIEWRNKNSNAQADLITATNERQMNEASINAREALIAQEIAQTPANVSTTANVLLARQFGARRNTIAQTETQAAAESTKQIEASVMAGSVISGITPFSIQPEKPAVITKTWRNVFDGHPIRPTHKAAHGQTVADDGIFFVGSSRFNFPGDTSFLPAPADLINCHCSAEYKII